MSFRMVDVLHVTGEESRPAWRRDRDTQSGDARAAAVGGNRPVVREPGHDRAPVHGRARTSEGDRVRPRAPGGHRSGDGRRICASHAPALCGAPPHRRGRRQRTDRAAQRARVADAARRARRTAGPPASRSGTDVERGRRGHRPRGLQGDIRRPPGLRPTPGSPPSLSDRSDAPGGASARRDSERPARGARHRAPSASLGDPPGGRGKRER